MPRRRQMVGEAKKVESDSRVNGGGAFVILSEAKNPRPGVPILHLAQNDRILLAK